MALAVKWSAAFIIVVLLVLQLVCCSRHSPDVRDDDGDDSRHGAVPRYSSPARRQSTYVYTSYFALVGERSIAISLSVCLCVCVCLYAGISLEPLDRSSRDPLWPWLGPHLAALRYVMYFRFYGLRHVWP